ncbi:MAG TPA: helix-turn-helix domain-containing protein [Candidatus Saccharimonadales bacterium]|nr:helix-turn-helix domain-containing protein [Candidatus Saccharimonadales bacterium]
MDTSDPRINRALILIEENLDKPLRLSDILSDLHISRSHFEHLFKRQIGTSFRRYRKEMRLRRAAVLLSNWRLRVSEIAYTVGYGDLSNFSRDFRESFRTTPSEYRRLLLLSGDCRTASSRSIPKDHTFNMTSSVDGSSSA